MLPDGRILIQLANPPYLVAFDPSRADWRNFRLDRMSEPALTGHRFEGYAV